MRLCRVVIDEESMVGIVLLVPVVELGNGERAIERRCFPLTKVESIGRLRQWIEKVRLGGGHDGGS